MRYPVQFRNAKYWDGKQFQFGNLTFDRTILSSTNQPKQVIDLSGYTVYPGFINAHDHLELNHYPRTKYRQTYDNAHQWGEDINRRLDTSPFRELQQYILNDRLFIGGLKNLLCGATTVIHHNPPHKPLFRKQFPVRVIQDYRWSHSLHFADETEIAAAYD